MGVWVEGQAILKAKGAAGMMNTDFYGFERIYNALEKHLVSAF